MRVNYIPKEEFKLPESDETVVNKTADKLDMVIAFDTTGSMSSYIQSVKNRVKELIPKLFKSNPNLMLSVVAFGDYCDMKSSTEFGKAYQVINLTNDENKLIDFVTNAEDTSGGDTDEFYEIVIKTIIEETKWREGSEKAVLLIGDASPHRIGYSYKTIVKNAQIDWKEEARKAAALKIKFDTLKIHQNELFYDELSSITNGVCLPFSNDKKTSEVVYAMSLARGGAATRIEFNSMSKTVADDAELKAVYTTYSKTLTDI